MEHKGGREGWEAHTSSHLKSAQSAAPEKRTERRTWGELGELMCGDDGRTSLGSVTLTQTRISPPAVSVASAAWPASLGGGGKGAPRCTEEVELEERRPGMAEAEGVRWRGAEGSSTGAGVHEARRTGEGWWSMCMWGGAEEPGGAGAMMGSSWLRRGEKQKWKGERREAKTKRRDEKRRGVTSARVWPQRQGRARTLTPPPCRVSGAP